MRPTKIYFLLSLIGIFAMSSCVDFNDATQAINLQVQVVQPTDFVKPSSLEGLEVKLKVNDNEQTAITDAQGVATFKGITPDVYSISTSWELTSNRYSELTGDNITVSGATVTGTINAQLISQDAIVDLPTQVAVNRDIIISKVYYAGSKDNNNKNYIAGKYIELYNQSDRDIDVSGLYIGLVETESNPAYTLENLRTAFNDSIVLLKQLFQIPGESAVKLAPGKTLLIANSAIDHSGKGQYENNLLEADFEAKDASGKTVNNPAVPGLSLIYTVYPAISNMNILNGGPCGLVIFRTTTDIQAMGKTYSYGKTSGNEWIKLPKRYIIDGVDIIRKKNTGVDISSKRMGADIDAGYINIESVNGYTGEVVYRKTSRTTNGKKLLLDTNNSSQDFQVSTSVKIRQYDE